MPVTQAQSPPQVARVFPLGGTETPSDSGEEITASDVVLLYAKLNPEISTPEITVLADLLKVKEDQVQAVLDEIEFDPQQDSEDELNQDVDNFLSAALVYCPQETLRAKFGSIAWLAGLNLKECSARIQSILSE